MRLSFTTLACGTVDMRDTESVVEYVYCTVGICLYIMRCAVLYNMCMVPMKVLFILMSILTHTCAAMG